MVATRVVLVDTLRKKRMSSTATMKQDSQTARRGRPRHAVTQLAADILSFYRQSQSGAEGAGVEVPSERELAEHFGVTRHAVRKALEHLDRHGQLKRVSGRGAYLPVGTSVGGLSLGTDLKCINFIQAPVFQGPSLQWVLSQYLAGYTEVLENHSVKTRFVFCGDDETDFGQLLWDPLPWDQQGCVLVNRNMPGLLDWLHSHDVSHVVQFYRMYEDRDADLRPHHRVYVNKIGAAAKATQHLLELGHRRIGFVGRCPQDMQPGNSCSPEFEGYASGMRCEGLPINPKDLQPLTGELISGAVEPCKQFLSQNNDVTAIVTANGAMAEGLLLAAEAVGLDVPGQLSVVGFSGSSPQVESRLTHIHIPQRELAHLAVQFLLEIAENKPPDYQSKVLHCDLIVNQTTAPPAS